jgi:predicted patatin/cPLA2 family phospholipase
MAYHDVPIKYDPFDMDTFLKNPMRFELVCTNVENGAPVYHTLENGDIHEFLEWIRASASMPLVSNAVKIGEYKLLDGGISDSIPLKHFQQEGFEKNTVILSQPAGFRKKQTKLTPIFKLFCKYPAIADAMAHRHLMYNDQLDYIEAEEKKGNTFLIYPETALNIGRAEMNTEKMDKVYQMGRKKGEKILNEVIDFLKD